MMIFNRGIGVLLLAVVGAGCGGANESVTVVEAPDTTLRNAHYVSNRPPLAPSALIKLPVGAIEPHGWLRRYLELQRDGLTGRLPEISAWLQKDGNAWLSPDGRGEWGWEEVPYWLRGYGNIGYILDDPAMIEEARVWIESTLNSGRPDGDFGPIQRFEDDGTRDFWANVIMLYVLQSYHEHSSDPRVLDLMSGFFKYQNSLPDDSLLTHYWQYMRGGDNLYGILWLYNRTGDPELLELADKIHANTADWGQPGGLPNLHNVNVAQGFREPATYFLRSRDSTDLNATYANFRHIRERFGQVPGGMWGGDENSREGYDDPRQAIETCGVVEQLLSNEMLLRITGDPFWADHAEEVAFNTAPAAYLPDFRGLRYLTAPNMVVSDAASHHPAINNDGPFFMLSALSHRCCQHNHSQGWPYLSENLWMATPDNGVAAVIYAASSATVTVGEGTEVTVAAETHYPFEEQIRFTVRTPEAAAFPLYLRVPAWSQRTAVQINGAPADMEPAPGTYVRIERTWHDGDTVVLDLPMDVRVRTWTANHHSASVDYGPLTFSLKIGERYQERVGTETAVWDAKWQANVDTEAWPAYELFPTTPWNYGLVFDETDPAASFTVEKRPWPEDDFPFRPDDVPLVMTARAKRIPQWTIDASGLAGLLKDSPVRSSEPTETVELIPMGAARLRISAFPVIGEGPDAHAW